MPDVRLIFINRFFSPDHSATAQILADLTQHLASEGRQVHVITSRTLYSDPGVSLPSRDRVDGAQVTRVWTSRFGRANLLGRAFDYLSFYPTMAVALWRLARRGDIVVAKTDPPLLSVVAAVVTRLKGAKLINWLQDLYPEIAVELGMKGLAGPSGALVRRLRDASLRQASVNVAIGAKMADRIRALGVDGDKVTIIPNWSDDRAITPQPRDAGGLRTEWGLAADDFVVGYSGNLGQAHEVDTLLEAAIRLKDRPQIKFLFVGGGRHSEGLRERVQGAGLSSFVFQPYQPRERLAYSLAAPDIHWLSLRPAMEGLVLPSKLYGIAAAGRGVIVIAARDGEFASLVHEHQAGVAVEPGDVDRLYETILALFEDRGRCQAMGLAARRMLDRSFTKAASLARWSALITRIAAA